MDDYRKSPNLVLLWGGSDWISHALHDQSTCEGMTKAMSSEMLCHRDWRLADLHGQHGHGAAVDSFNRKSNDLTLLPGRDHIK